LQPGQQVLNVGLGTGKEHQLIQGAVAPGGLAFGVDLSPRMLALARQRTGAPLCLADGGRLPFAGQTFDRLYCAYVLDLVPMVEIPDWLAGFRRALEPGGRMVLLSLTEGVDSASRAFVRLWKLAYTVSPIACGGCRPLQLTELAQRAGFCSLERQVIVQYGVPSEVIVAT
jgi:ubiquinone/menaquinone biosynthesis C-methylase UbiE